MVKVGREIMEGKGLCFTCHTIGKTGALRFPDLAGVDVRAKSRVAGPERRRVLRPVDVRAQRLHRAGIQSGDADHQQAADRPHRSGDPLRHRLPAEPRRDTDRDASDEAPLQQRRGRAARVAASGDCSRPRCRAGRSAAAASRSGAMNILVVLAVAAAFGLLRFRRASLLVWAGAWWVGIYVLLRFGFTAPIPSSVVSLYMGIVSLAILAYVSSSQERRDEVFRPLVRFMTEKRYTALLGATVVALPALAAANVYVQMSVPIQPPLFSRTVHPASPSDDHRSRQEDRSRLRRESLPLSRDVESGRVPHARRERAQGLLSELRLLPRRQHVRQRHVRARPGSDPDQLPRHDPAASRDVSVLANRQGRSRACPKKVVPGTRPCRPGRSS